jgi:prepilin-type N-terminal cleavage/methylation domain-containing protein
MRNINKKIKDSRFKIQDSNKESSILNFQFSMNKGMTLIEIMIVVAILAVMSSTLFSVFQGGLFSQRRGTNKALVYSEARAALDMMSREIEKAFVDERIGAHYELFDGGSGYRISSIEDEFYFVVPMDNGGETDLCKVGYWLSADNVLRRYFIATDSISSYDTYKSNTEVGGDYWEQASINSGANELIGNVSDLQFQWWNNSIPGFDDNTISGDVLPRAIKIIITMQYEMEKDVADTAIFTTVVSIPGSGQ